MLPTSPSRRPCRVRQERREEQRVDDEERRHAPGPRGPAERHDVAHEAGFEDGASGAPRSHGLGDDGADQEQACHERRDVGRLLRREADREQAEQCRGMPAARLVEEAQEDDEQSECHRRHVDVLTQEA